MLLKDKVMLVTGARTLAQVREAGADGTLLVADVARADGARRLFGRHGMPDDGHMLPRLALAGVLLLPSVQPLLAQDVPGASRGELLYETHCIQCHTRQMHWRDARVARDWRSLREQVESWQARIGERWTTEEVDDVARHLNTTIYHYPVPSEHAARDGRAPMSSSP